MTAIHDISEVARGFASPEGPCVDRHGRLHLVEMAHHCVSRVLQGERSVLALLGGSPNGAAFSPNGDLYVANGGHTAGLPDGAGCGSYIQRVNAEGWSLTVLDEIDGEPLGSPESLAFDAEGGLYFTDPVRSPRASNGAPGHARSGYVCFLHPDGAAWHCHTGLSGPSGICLSADGDAVVVGEAATGLVHRFPVHGPGRLGAPQVHADLGHDVAPGGMAFDASGRLLVAGLGSHRLHVVAPGGTVESVLHVDAPEVSDVCFGGPNGRTLYVTLARSGRVVSTTWDTPGAPVPPRQPG